MIALGTTTQEQELGSPADTDAMIAETRTAAATARTWTPRVAAQLAVLAAAAFTYVTAELLPVGALGAAGIRKISR